MQFITGEDLTDKISQDLYLSSNSEEKHRFIKQLTCIYRSWEKLQEQLYHVYLLTNVHEFKGVLHMILI